MKTCTKCKVEQLLADFHKDKNRKDGLHLHCKVCVKQYFKKNKEAIADQKKDYYEQNKKHLIEYSKQWYKENSDYVCDIKKQYRKDNKHKVAGWKKQWEKERRANDPAHIMIKNLRSGLYTAMNGTSKPKKTMELLGCTREHFIHHLASQFTDGMNWKNYGVHGWHIDHMQPISLFDHNDPEQVAVCWHYTNLQPLWAKDNIRKSNKV